jgi:hypothetical protein
VPDGVRCGAGLGGDGEQVLVQAQEVGQRTLGGGQRAEPRRDGRFELFLFVIVEGRDGVADARVWVADREALAVNLRCRIAGGRALRALRALRACEQVNPTALLRPLKLP